MFCRVQRHCETQEWNTPYIVHLSLSALLIACFIIMHQYWCCSFSKSSTATTLPRRNGMQIGMQIGKYLFREPSKMVHSSRQSHSTLDLSHMTNCFPNHWNSSSQAQCPLYSVGGGVSLCSVNNVTHKHGGCSNQNIINLFITDSWGCQQHQR